MSRQRGRSRWSETAVAVAALAIALAAQFALMSVRGTERVVSGDEGTFLAMTESLALDGDLRFGPADLTRLEGADQVGRKAVILQEFGDETAYSKPIAYSLLAAPWFRVAGSAGLIACNLVALALALLLGWAALVRSGVAFPSLIVATFAGAGVLLSYTAWTMSDSLQASLTLAGLALGLGAARERGAEPSSGAAASRFARFWIGVLEASWAPLLGAVLLATVVSMRLPNLALAAAPAVAWLLRGRLRRAALFAVVLLATLAAGFVLNDLLAGSWMPYKAVRATFNPDSGYPVGSEAETARRQFRPDVARATQQVGVRPDWRPEVSLYSAVYFWVGRHTGLLWYFPAALLFLLAGLRRPDAVSLALLAATAALAVFYLVWLPENYFGGATFVGNRYFLTGYAALLLVPRRGVSRPGLAAAWLVALVVFVSALASASRLAGRDDTSQSHAYAGIFRWLPYETTAQAIDGRSDVYWTEEFFRFVDPYAVVDPTGFSLSVDDPPAELVHVNQRKGALVRFLVRANTDQGQVTYRGQGFEKHFELEPNESGVWGLVEIELQPTWRRHRYWFHPTERLHTRIHRFDFRNAGEREPGRRPPSAELHYLGSMRLVPKFFRGVTMAVELPQGAEAGTRSEIPIRVRNTGFRFWSSSEMVPTRLGYRLFRLPRRPDDRPVSGRLQAFEGRVPRANELQADLKVRWPKKPGRYELVIDLNLGGAVWYESWNQKPLARTEVSVRPAGEVGEAES